jgi:uncharacterized protein with PIN domain
VGVEPRVRGVEAERPLRFFADAMLGRLARWLRVLGFDTAYQPHIDDAQLVQRAVEEGRVVLTRDRALREEWRVSDLYLVEAEGSFEQVREVVRAFSLADAVRLFSRCNRCNTGLTKIAREEVRARVPERVFARQHEFRRCPSCGRVYWDGSHTDRMRRAVERILEGA